MTRPISKRARILRMALAAAGLLLNVPLVFVIIWAWQIGIPQSSMIVTLATIGVDILLITLLVFIYKLNECIELHYTKSMIGYIIAISLLFIILAAIGISIGSLRAKGDDMKKYIPKIRSRVPVETVSNR